MADDNTGPIARLREAVSANEGTAKLAEAVQGYVSAKATNLVSGSAKSLGQTVERLVGEGDGSPAKEAVKGAASAGGQGLKDKAKGLVGKIPGVPGGGDGGGGGGGGSSSWPVNIVEDIDVGVPVRVAYNQWTRFPDFGEFAKGVVNVEEKSETESRWNAKIFWSSRSWDGRVTEQIQDYKIAWTTESDKGTTDGVVTFHPLGENLTRLLLVTEYYPVGFFEKTANLWRAQGRRLRLDLKHYRREVMMMAEADAEELEGWRGEIRDEEVVVSHEEALEQEQAEEESGEEPADDEDLYEDEGDEEDEELEEDEDEEEER